MCKAASNELSIRSNWSKSLGESNLMPNPNNVDAYEVSDHSDDDYGNNLESDNGGVFRWWSEQWRRLPALMKKASILKKW